MNPRLQTTLAGLLNPFLLIPAIIFTYWACASISSNYMIKVIQAECKQIREK